MGSHFFGRKVGIRTALCSYWGITLLRTSRVAEVMEGSSHVVVVSAYAFMLVNQCS